MKFVRLIILVNSMLFLSGCSGCSKSGRRQVVMNKIQKENSPDFSIAENRADKTIVKMKKVNGVYEVPTIINGIPMQFIFDNGAGLISI